MVACQALTRKNLPCGHPATHRHETDNGTIVWVCGHHLRVLKRRERLGSDEEILAGWNVPAQQPS